MYAFITTLAVYILEREPRLHLGTFELVPFEVAVADAGRTTVGKLMFTVANSRPLLESSGVLAVPGILSEVHQNALKLLYVGM